MAKKPNRLGQKTRAQKREQEAAEGLTFLEKLVLRALPTRQVPRESGVQFAISSKAKDDGICLVLKVDDQDAPIVEKGPRPDYLVVHASRDACLLTIVEMKGREEKNVEHGIEQIRAMYHRLRQEMATCLPGSWRRAKIQAVLLTPPNAQLNWKKIEDARKEGIEILPVQYHHQAELYPYISEPVSRTKAYSPVKLPREKAELNAVEQLIAEGKLERRPRNALFKNRCGADKDTFFLSFRRKGDPKGAFVSLSATTEDAIIAFTTAATQCRSDVETHLRNHKLTCPALRMGNS